ncbi:hypothetical protein X992_5940 [Burkholderia pseudomallei MSHR5492]|nr:putative lysine exporter protein [Burkholderia pseudomallei]KGR93648.1 hypothetical protein X948_5473 [Burkholderia pseudomallei MSHR5608]KGS16880.1 hypothetical protein X989_5733 [Burkholderia pseudomallei MSHR4378]KGS36524.1 hypothetical protein X992_5940 [Burkholderia pseudomallei MSHR5492]KGS73652.1 hypothetical protein X947_5725 [Burkholderia pseudomallei MSHR7334]
MIFGLPSVTAMPVRNMRNGDCPRGSWPDGSSAGANHIFHARNTR